jgi:hypothetical protein
MLVERGPVTSPDEDQIPTSILHQPEIKGRVALAAFFNTQTQVSVEEYDNNGHGNKYDVVRQHSAAIAGLLEAHSEVEKLRKDEGLPSTDRLFAFQHASTGELYDNVRLEHISSLPMPNGRSEHTAIFTYPEHIHSDHTEVEAIRVPIDDIYWVEYAKPSEAAVLAAEEESLRREAESWVRD